MGKMDSTWHPAWWKDEIHGTAWGLVSESMRRDWEQTKHDMGMGGHELHQGVDDTLKQACGAEPLPNPGEVSPSDWSEAQDLYGYGFAAHREFGLQHPQWSRQLEAKLKSEWIVAHDHATLEWRSVVNVVRRGYEFADAPKTPDSAR